MPSPNDIQTARFSDVLWRLLGIEGKAPAREIATEIFPTLTLENDRPEWAALGGTRHAFGRMSAINAAGPVSCSVANPANSGALLVVTWGRGTIDNGGGAGEFSWGLGSAANVTSAPGTARFADTRIPPGTTTARPVGVLQAFNGINAIAIKDQIIIPINALTNQEFRGPLMISPGFAVTVQSSVVNRTMRASFEWYERHLPDRERLAG